MLSLRTHVLTCYRSHLPHTDSKSGFRLGKKRESWKATENFESQPSIIGTRGRKSTRLWIVNQHSQMLLCGLNTVEEGSVLRTITRGSKEVRDYRLTASVHKYFCWVFLNSATSKKPWNLGRNSHKLHKWKLSISLITKTKLHKHGGIFSYFKFSTKFWNEIKFTLIFKKCVIWHFEEMKK